MAAFQTVESQDINLESLQPASVDVLEHLISEVQSYPILWNKASPEYKETHKKRLVWVEIARKLGVTVDFAKAKWKNLNDTFKKCLDREREMTKSGSAYSKPPRCRYYSQLLFLRDVLTNRMTSSNILLSIPSTSSNSGQQEYSEFAPSPYPVSETLSSPSLASPLCGADLEDLQSPPSNSSSERVALSCTPKNVPFAATRKRKNAEADPIESFLMDSIREREREKVEKKQDDPDDLFCRSLVATLKRLPQKKNQLAKLKMQQLLFDIEYEDQ